MEHDGVFQRRDEYRPDQGYQLLPFRFARLDGDRYILTNEVGEYVLISRDELVALVGRQLNPCGEPYRSLKSKHFFFDDRSRVAIDLLALKYRSRTERVSWFTGLHIFVVTLRCDHSCHYCQVSRQTEDRANFDMSAEDADRALEFTFRSPSPFIKIEFQGGEPLLRFDLVQYIVERALAMNEKHRRTLQFVIASNLSRLTDEMLAFCKKHEVLLSTSLDGPADLHRAQRPLRDGDSYEITIDGIRRARAALGREAVSALMTTTQASLARAEEIIDEYVRQGFHSIFLRSVSPFGFASRRSLMRRYAVDDWLAFYRRGLAHVLAVNHQGYPLREEFTTILLQKMFSPMGSGYVDLQSPAGLGIGALVYNYDGAVYASDEGRMLAEMGDQSFCLGRLGTDSYETMMTSERFVSMLSDTMPEGAPMCSDCPFLPYCGADPVFHVATRGDPVGHKAWSAFCKKQMGVLRHLIDLLESDREARDIMLGWL